MAGLRLGGVPVSSNAAKEQIKKSLEILEDIQDRVRQMGLADYPKPSTAPTPLSDIKIGSLTNRDLETHLTAYTAWATFILPKLAEAEAAYKIGTVNLKRITASLKVDLFKDKTTRAEIDARVAMSPEYLEHELEHLKLFATKEILEAYYKAYSKQAQALSRVVEMRKLEFEQETRATSVGNYRQGQKRPAGGLPGAVRR